MVGRPELIEAIKLFRYLGGKVVVEIGSIRDEKAGLSDGHSTLFFAEHASKVFSVDVDRQATELTRRLTERFGTVEAITQDGISFLEDFSQPIDLLYLDGLDATLPGSQEFHLLAYRAARKNLHDRSVIVIDDADPSVLHRMRAEALGEEVEFVPCATKAAMVVPEAEKDGFEVGIRHYQFVLAKHQAIAEFLRNYDQVG